ncbi:UvrD-helicase domain-containing protein [Streptomyces acidiscabies]|uniref:DNA 3'-5' helicase n=1 Tax=Streptomyces acidiscabies TaxID=42234 RepID=A0AAP6EET5_9ACTN|nr:UvrD-helicase domain-containing protein [Streptomyces acidiscabies]MBZ3910526.1 ATP-dependent helicase [Streptomyces acidiscabies]MDX2959526.1 UvrD-helicase domain-containing protein [Streptomyces acidiscabies]MDX3019186.1 UvrD-helicase domain-containing protein [Streptomyces acidiscabies]MDX3790733.1 UvrD-helicase domain-containing protein [Streptomyces acidiscabies]GAQ57801.1 DNA helicase IV [Streptomyces acidiscabies]
MTEPYEGSPPLTDEQRAVVDLPWDARLLVTAGAGTGKTHTVVRRLDALVGHEIPEEALSAGEILVLSFSNAAVRELRDRIARHGERAHRVRVQTFDSWAYQLLVRAYPGEDWKSLSFDERIGAATDAIEKGAVEAGELGAPAHVVIDEAQDLVGVRRDLVEALLDRFQRSCGFTVVGDSAQGIYGFQIDDPVERAGETDRFFAWLRTSYDDIVELALTENFRARSPEARTALPLNPRLQALLASSEGQDASAAALHTELRDLLLDLPGLGDLSDAFTLGTLKAFPGTCAILTRDNREALAVSELLYAHGVEHALKRSLRDRPVPYWVAELLRRTESSTLTEARFLGLLAETLLPQGVDPVRCWRSLLTATRHSGRRVVDIAAVGRLVAEGRFPEDLSDPETALLTVSTVHRAKGLEFDRVLVLSPRSLAELRKSHADLDVPAEARTLYVAMTRSREDLYHVTGPDTARIRRHRPSGRWYLGGWQKYERYGIQARAGDIHTVEPPRSHTADISAAEIQDHLLKHARPGDPVTLRRRHPLPAGPDQSPPYDLVHRDRIVGEVSEGFRRDLHAVEAISRSWDVAWPAEIVGLRVDTLETVAGSTAAGANAGLGDHGVWIAPRITGIGRYRRGERAGEERE